MEDTRKAALENNEYTYVSSITCMDNHKNHSRFTQSGICVSCLRSSLPRGYKDNRTDNKTPATAKLTCFARKQTAFSILLRWIDAILKHWIEPINIRRISTAKVWKEIEKEHPEGDYVGPFNSTYTFPTNVVNLFPEE